MAWSKDKGRGQGPGEEPGKRGYHHGNLRETLIRAALDLIGEKGPAGFTFADAARWAGVSPAAPYRHFRDRDALMADVARQGFERFEAFLKTAWNEGRPDPFTAFNNLGKAYLAFARTEPAYFAAMFEAGGRPVFGSVAQSASDAVRRIPKARSPAWRRSALDSSERPASNIAE